MANEEIDAAASPGPNKEIARRWVEALRSGKYEQTTAELHNNSGFCCLGVLCEIAVEDGVIEPAAKKDDAESSYYYEGQGGIPPRKVAEWLGIDSDWQVAFPEELKASKNDCGDDTCDCGHDDTIGLTELNDSKRWTFHQIADVIEKEFIGA